VLAVLVMLGGFTALFGGLVMLTQSAVKTSLAWSTVAQMGFMILQCGLALFPLALLHIVAHSLYKAHAFLASGQAVDGVAAIRRPGPVAIPNGTAVVRAFASRWRSTRWWADLRLHRQVAAGHRAWRHPDLRRRLPAGPGPRRCRAEGPDAAHGALFAGRRGTGYFALQTGAEWLMKGTLPATPAPGPLEWALIVLALISFGLVAIAQALFPLWAYHPASAGLRVHLANGLYINAVFDKLLRGWSIKRAS
jgi:NAD(P)H-quinone oxidoreductase subunit 5